MRSTVRPGPTLCMCRINKNASRFSRLIFSCGVPLIWRPPSINPCVVAPSKTFFRPFPTHPCSHNVNVFFSPSEPSRHTPLAHLRMASAGIDRRTASLPPLRPRRAFEAAACFRGGGSSDSGDRDSVVSGLRPAIAAAVKGVGAGKNKRSTRLIIDHVRFCLSRPVICGWIRREESGRMVTAVCEEQFFSLEMQRRIKRQRTKKNWRDGWAHENIIIVCVHGR